MTSISVVIPAFNRAGTIARAIDSVLRQEWRGGSIELIVVDDGSTDDTLSVLQNYGDRLCIVRHEQNRGAAAARNTGVAAATGDYVAFLDSDDEWMSEKLTGQIAAMRANAWNASCTAYFLTRSGVPDIVSPRGNTVSLGLSDLLWGCFVSPGSTLVFERGLFAEVGPLDTSLGRLEDWDWLLRFARSRPLGFLSTPLARIHASRHTNTTPVLAAIETLRAKHSGDLGKRDRNHFAAALDFERAAALYRAGKTGAALPAVVKSLSRSLFYHPPLRAVLHNMQLI